MTVLKNVEFEKLLECLNACPLSSLMDLLLGDLDAISKNFIKKNYKTLHNMGSTYKLYCEKTKLWNDHAKPLLILIAIKQKKIKVINNKFECPRCKKTYENWRELTPHHKRYTNLFNYRVKLNHPRSIEVMCIACHEKEHHIRGDI